MAMAGLYRRLLLLRLSIPLPLKERLKELFVQAIQNGTMEGFYRLISYFQTQSEPEYCGLASLSMILNALAIDPGRKWKGTGHFSPIGGYRAGRDMALILVVARFKYPPRWVPLTFLWFMLISRHHTDPGMVYTLSRRHESWTGIAKYLVDDVPRLLNSEDVKDIHKLFYVVFKSLPSNFGEFIKWVAEVRRQEDDSRSLSQEEKGSLAVKEEVLKQVQETGLFKHVAKFLSSSKSCCGNIPILSKEDDLPRAAASVRGQGAEIVAGKCGSSGGYCCGETCVSCLKTNGDKPVTLVSGTVVDGPNEQGLDVLVSSCQMKLSCCGCGSSNSTGMHPAGNDVLTVLLFSLPPKTWSGIKDEKLLLEINTLVSTQNLPVLLQDEVLHLHTSSLPSEEMPRRQGR